MSAHVPAPESFGESEMWTCLNCGRVFPDADEAVGEECDAR